MLEYRFFASFLSGMLLTLSGSLIQGVTQNELAGPSTLGLQAYVIIIILITYGCTEYFFPYDLNFPLEYISFIVFIIITLILYITIKRIVTRPERPVIISNRFQGPISFFILLGLCINLCVGAILSLVQFVFIGLNKQFPQQLWYGNFRFVELSGVLFLCFYTSVIYYFTIRLAKYLRVICFGTDLAFGLGVKIRKVQIQSLLISLAALGIVCCFYGIFAFVGLVFPHLLRSFNFFRRSMQKELLYGPIIGGLIFALLDYFCWEYPVWGQEFPVGMLCGPIGTVLLIYLLLRDKIRSVNKIP